MRKFSGWALVIGTLSLVVILVYVRTSKEISKCEEVRRTGVLVDVVKEDRRSYSEYYSVWKLGNRYITCDSDIVEYAVFNRKRK